MFDSPLRRKSLSFLASQAARTCHPKRETLGMPHKRILRIGVLQYSYAMFLKGVDLLPLLTPRELAAEMPPKMPPRIAYIKCWQFREAGRIAYILYRRSCRLSTFNVGNSACLTTFLETFPPPVRERLSPLS